MMRKFAKRQARREIKAADLVELLGVRHHKDVFVAECNTGASSYEGCGRMDAWAMVKSWANPCVYGYEIKVSRSDFLRDEKWRSYLEFCNEFYFVAPPKLIDPLELPAESGLLVCSANGTQLYKKKASPRRDNEIPDSVFRYILFSRCRITREYWTRERNIDFWREWLAGKQDLCDLGHRISRRLQKRISEEVIEVRDKQRWLEEKLEQLRDVRDMLTKLGFDAQHVPYEFEVRRRLTEAVPKAFLQTCLDMQSELNDLVNILEALNETKGATAFSGGTEPEHEAIKEPIR